MKERPILFSAEMVRAIVEGRKTQTRRVVKFPNKHPFNREWKTPFYVPRNGVWIFTGGFGGSFRRCRVKSPFGQPGDQLWVRETFLGGFKLDTKHLEFAGYLDINGRRNGDYKLKPPLEDTDRIRNFPRSWKKVPSIHMPRWAARILVEITDVRVERVEEISHQDAWSEGIDLPVYAPVLDDKHPSPRDKFRELWDSINGGKTGASWGDNPFVWVVTFRRVDEE